MAYMSNTLNRLFTNRFKTKVSPVLSAYLRFNAGNRDLAPLAETKSEDILLTEIKSARTTNEVFKIISKHNQILNLRHTIESLKSLFDASKKDTSPSSHVIHHPSFEMLCSRLKKHSRIMDLNEIIDILKILNFLGVPSNSTICQYLLQLIRQGINELTLSQVIFLDFVLRKTQPNHLTDALRLAMPLVFQLQIADQMDHDNIQHLSDLLTYAGRNNIPEKYVNNIITSLVLHGNSIEPKLARYIVSALCKIDVPKNDVAFKKLLNSCLNILTENLNSFEYIEVIRLMNFLKDGIIQRRECFYHEKFFQACAIYSIENLLPFDKTIQIVKILSRIAHTDIDLLDYLAELIGMNPETILDASVHNLLNVVNAYSNANYKPENWDTVKNLILKNPINWNKKVDLPWIKFCFELATLDCYNDVVLNRIFSNSFLEEFLRIDDNNFNYIQLVHLYHSVIMFNKSYNGNFPSQKIIHKATEVLNNHRSDPAIKSAIEFAIGGSEYLISDILMPQGIFVDFIMHYHDGSPVPIDCNSSDQVIKYDDLKINNPENTVCIMVFSKTCYSQNNNRLRGSYELTVRILTEAGFKVMVLPASDWLNMPVPERIPYLQQNLNLIASEKSAIDEI